MHLILNDAKAPLDVIYFAAKEGIENPRACSRIMYRDHNQFLSVVKIKKKKNKKKKKKNPKAKKSRKKVQIFNSTLYISACLKAFGKCSSTLKMQVLKE